MNEIVTTAEERAVLKDLMRRGVVLQDAYDAEVMVSLIGKHLIRVLHPDKVGITSQGIALLDPHVPLPEHSKAAERKYDRDPAFQPLSDLSRHTLEVISAHGGTLDETAIDGRSKRVLVGAGLIEVRGGQVRITANGDKRLGRALRGQSSPHPPTDALQGRNQGKARPSATAPPAPESGFETVSNLPEGDLVTLIAEQGDKSDAVKVYLFDLLMAMNPMVRIAVAEMVGRARQIVREPSPGRKGSPHADG